MSLTMNQRSTLGTPTRMAWMIFIQTGTWLKPKQGQLGRKKLLKCEDVVPACGCKSVSARCWANACILKTEKQNMAHLLKHTKIISIYLIDCVLDSRLGKQYLRSFRIKNLCNVFHILGYSSFSFYSYIFFIGVFLKCIITSHGAFTNITHVI